MSVSIEKGCGCVDMDARSSLRLSAAADVDGDPGGVGSLVAEQPEHRARNLGRVANPPERDGGGQPIEAAGIADGDRVRVSSRRGTVEAAVAFDPSLRPGLASFTPHFTEEVDVNVLTNDAWDPQSGTAEFKATAIRIDKLTPPHK